MKITLTAGVLFVLLCSINPSAIAQDAVAMLKFEDAEKAYNTGDYPKVLEALDEVEEMVGVTSKTLYLRVVSQNELFAGGSNLYDDPEQFELLLRLREHAATYLEAMGSQGLDDKYRTVYRIQESLKEYPVTEQEWQIAFEEEEAKKIKREYHDNGQLKSIGKVEDGKRTGEWKGYNSNGILVESVNYKPSGDFTITRYYENGQVKRIDRFNAENQTIGIQEEYYENGQLRKKGLYSKYYSELLKQNQSVRTGEWKSYHENGKLWIVSNYNDKGQFIGEHKVYHSNGQIAEEGIYELYDSGHVTGKAGMWKYYHENGQVKSIENYSKPGRKEGEVEEFYENGKIKSVAKYEDGKRISFREYYESGQLSLTVLPEDEGKWKYFYRNGKLKEVGAFVELTKYKQGEWKSYHENGQLAKEEIYYVDKLDGDWISYYSNGQVKEKGEYVKGGRDGRWEAFYENGQLKEKGRYKSIAAEYSYLVNESFKDSRWTYFHPNGEVKAKGKYEEGEKVGKWDYYDEQGNRISN